MVYQAKLNWKLLHDWLNMHLERANVCHAGLFDIYRFSIFWAIWH